MTKREEFGSRRPEALEFSTENAATDTKAQFNKGLVDTHPEIAAEMAAIIDGSKKASEASWTKFSTKVEFTSEDESTQHDTLDEKSPAGAIHGFFESSASGWDQDQRRELARHVAELTHTPLRAALQEAGVEEPLSPLTANFRTLDTAESERFQGRWHNSLNAATESLVTGDEEAFALTMNNISELVGDALRWHAHGGRNTVEARAAEIMGPDNDWREITLPQNRELLYQMGDHRSGYSDDVRMEWATDATRDALTHLTTGAQSLERSSDAVDQSMGMYFANQADAARINMTFGIYKRDRALYDLGTEMEVTASAELTSYLEGGTVPAVTPEQGGETRWQKEARRHLEQANAVLAARS